jgi:predicted transcriptional regulator
MVNSCAVCGCCTRTDIVREHLEDTLRICDVSAKGLLSNLFPCVQEDETAKIIRGICLDDRISLFGLVIREAKDDRERALEVLRRHYQGKGKPRVIALYT